MQPIRQLARQACQAAVPGSPLAALQHLPLYRDSPTNALDEAITLLFAGQDTSAATLSWTLYLLSRHPQAQQRLADELQQCSSSSSSIDDNVDKKQQQQQRSMVYLDAVVKESMRLYPVAPFVVRQLGHDVTIPDGPLLPAGAMACIWIYSLHRNPDHWEEPDKFRPERWLSDTTAAKSTTTTTTPSTIYIPFAAGPRNCVGQPLANVVVRTILARLVGEFDVQDEVDAAAGPKRMQAGFTVLPQGGLKLRFVPRRQPVTTTTTLSASP
jgi:cytochrome P450